MARNQRKILKKFRDQSRRSLLYSSDVMWNAIVWGQLGAAIDMLENVIEACPDELWSEPTQRPQWQSHGVVGFWYVTYHALFFLDLQLSGSTDGFTPPAPFDLSELDPAGLLPERPYAKDELRRYVRHCREKGRATLAGLTEEKAGRTCRWLDLDMTFGELLLYTMRHVQHHAGQLQLLLRQNTGDAPRYVKRTASS